MLSNKLDLNHETRFTIKSNKHKNYNSKLKLKIAFLIEKYIQQMKEGNQTWLGLRF
jgi:hypothetical protein